MDGTLKIEYDQVGRTHTKKTCLYCEPIIFLKIYENTFIPKAQDLTHFELYFKQPKYTKF